MAANLHTVTEGAGLAAVTAAAISIGREDRTMEAHEDQRCTHPSGELGPEKQGGGDGIGVAGRRRKRKGVERERGGEEKGGIILYKTFSRFDLAPRRILMAALLSADPTAEPSQHLARMLSARNHRFSLMDRRG